MKGSAISAAMERQANMYLVIDIYWAATHQFYRDLHNATITLPHLALLFEGCHVPLHVIT